MQMDLRVVELLSSKLCHDIISPVSAINNGVELIEDIGDSVVKEAMALISDSAGQASRKLRYFRLSYGRAGAESNQPVKDIRHIIKQYFEASKIKFIWDEELTLPNFIERPGSVKALLNAILLGEEALAYGGTITLKQLNEEDIIGCVLEVAGKKASISPLHQDALTGKTPVDDLTPRTVQAYVTGQFAAQFSFDIASTQASEEVMKLSLTHLPNMLTEPPEDQCMQVIS